MLAPNGLVAECTGENIFVSRNGIVFTPPLSAGALEGITQSSVMTIAARPRHRLPRRQHRPQRPVHRRGDLRLRHGRRDQLGELGRRPLDPVPRPEDARPSPRSTPAPCAARSRSTRTGASSPSEHPSVGGIRVSEVGDARTRHSDASGADCSRRCGGSTVDGRPVRGPAKKRTAPGALRPKPLRRPGQLKWDEPSTDGRPAGVSLSLDLTSPVVPEGIGGRCRVVGPVSGCPARCRHDAVTLPRTGPRHRSGAVRTAAPPSQLGWLADGTGPTTTFRRPANRSGSRGGSVADSSLHRRR